MSGENLPSDRNDFGTLSVDSSEFRLKKTNTVIFYKNMPLSPVNKIAVNISWDESLNGVAFIFDTKDSKSDITSSNIRNLTF